MTNFKIGAASDACGPSSPSKTASTACVPPFYPHRHADRDVWAVSAAADGKIYVVFRGHGTGFFTNPQDANLQTDGFSAASQRSFERWDLARAAWDSFCGSDHRTICPAFQLAKGFIAAYPTPSATPPPAPSIPIVQASPLPAAAAPTHPTTPYNPHTVCVVPSSVSPYSPTPTLADSTPASPLSAPLGSQASTSGVGGARPRVTPMTRVALAPATAAVRATTRPEKSRVLAWGIRRLIDRPCY
ncbi:hypothetical protein B0H15DRAFT_951270 [Mycena belliarum]|uniref:Ribonuclease H1 N-terminal domain-containing protein n=1 Tax=Mycena belliarum TaxID=1033014 RepID=A0AAD6U1L6_9AGAR|nr:hypothetical protein B0H15DRAFT_951270 [Mycena belliae]